jgi:hypothetical protein
MAGVIQVVDWQGNTFSARRVTQDGVQIYPPDASNLVSVSDAHDLSEEQLLVKSFGVLTGSTNRPTTTPVPTTTPPQTTPEPTTTSPQTTPVPTTTPPQTTPIPTTTPPGTTTKAGEWYCYNLEYWTAGTACSGAPDGSINVCVQNGGQGEIEDCWSALNDPYGVYAAANAVTMCSCVQLIDLAGGPYENSAECGAACIVTTTPGGTTTLPAPGAACSVCSGATPNHVNGLVAGVGSPMTAANGSYIEPQVVNPCFFQVDALAIQFLSGVVRATWSVTPGHVIVWSITGLGDPFDCLAGRVLTHDAANSEGDGITAGVGSTCTITPNG